MLALAACGAPVGTTDTPPGGLVRAGESEAERPPEPAPEPQGETLTLARLFDSPNLSGPSPRALRFSPDGSRVTFLRPKAEDRSVLDLWAVDVEGGEPYRLVDARVLVAEERALSEAEQAFRERARISESGVVQYDWDASGEAVLVPLDGDIFYVDVESGEARRLMETEAFETDARVSPQGGYVSFIRDQNFWLHRLDNNRDVQVTAEGGGTISWGVAEFVAQEEMRRYTGYWWSPDDARVALTRVDESPVEIVERLEIDGTGLTSVEQRYPLAGTDNARVSLHVFDLQSGRIRSVDLGADTDIYIARVDWSRDGSTLYVQRQNRAQTRLDLLAVDPRTGRADLVLSETADTWVNLTNDFTPLEDGGFLWTSERTGFRHIYRYGADGEAVQITSGEWVVDEIAGVDEASGVVWFEGWTQTPLERHLYRTRLYGAQAPERLTPPGGWCSANVGSGGTGFIATCSNPDTPPQTALYGPDGERRVWIEENALDETHPYAPYLPGHLTPEFGTLTAADGETTLHYSILKDDQCTAETPCPAIVEVYGGPLVQTVRRSWTSGRDQAFARAGYVVFRLDNRGSWNRGHAFEAALHRRMGGVEVEDQLAGLDFLKAQPFVDSARIGLRGWSYGGYMTLMTTLTAPGAFASGIAGAPVTDWAKYDTHYTERYMGAPQDNPDGYAQGAPVNLAENYETPLFIIHGMSDDNVTFDNTTAMVLALQQAGKQFDLMTYPGQRHGVRPQDLRTHLEYAMAEFFEETLDGPQAP
jgi:dipeptidyl-peptidase-4